MTVNTHKEEVDLKYISAANDRIVEHLIVALDKCHKEIEAMKLLGVPARDRR